MKKNMSNADRWIRVLLVAAVAMLYGLELISGVLAIVLGAVAVIFLVTSIVSFCPLYRIVGVSTCKVPKSSD
jgi:hypothetical protein